MIPFEIPDSLLPTHPGAMSRLLGINGNDLGVAQQFINKSLQAQKNTLLSLPQENGLRDVVLMGPATCLLVSYRKKPEKPRHK